MNNRIFVLAVFCVVLMMLISCKTKQPVISETPINSDKADTIRLMKKNQFQFHTLSLKFTADVQTGEEINDFSGNIYIVKDTTIWISVQKLGLEAFRLLITPDSVKILDRINKIFIAGDYMALNEILKTDFDFDILQALITGNDPDNYETAGFSEKNENGFIILVNGNRKKKSGDIDPGSINQELWLSSGDYKICKNIIREDPLNSSRIVEFDYSEFQDFDGQKFPQKIDFQVSDTKTTKGGIVYTRVNPEKKETFPFTVPASYERK
ncbi:MAG TPA: DUF4292 domain-containing protein [Bacteroidales bacterium]|nr:DUF4292 domain-containing protein [Bacteroidales bacterium]